MQQSLAAPEPTDETTTPPPPSNSNKAARSEQSTKDPINITP